MDAGADKLTDGRLDGRTDGQRDGHRNEQGRTDRPSFSEDDSVELFDHMCICLQGMQLTNDSSTPSMYQLA